MEQVHAAESLWCGAVKSTAAEAVLAPPSLTFTGSGRPFTGESLHLTHSNTQSATLATQSMLGSERLVPGAQTSPAARRILRGPAVQNSSLIRGSRRSPKDSSFSMADSQICSHTECSLNIGAGASARSP